MNLEEFQAIWESIVQKHRYNIGSDLTYIEIEAALEEYDEDFAELYNTVLRKIGEL